MENKKGWIITISILILIIIGLSTFIAYDKGLIIKKKETSEIVINDISIDLNAYHEIGKTLDVFDRAFNNKNTSYYGYIYNSKKIIVENFDIKAALYVSVYKYLVGTNNLQYINANRVKKDFEKIFGPNLKYVKSDIEVSKDFAVKYDTENNVYYYQLTPFIDEEYGYQTVNIKTKLENDKVVITRKVYYLETDEKNAYIYRDASKSNLIGTVTNTKKSVSSSEIISKYGSKLKTYKYIFKQNNNYYNLYSIEQVEK